MPSPTPSALSLVAAALYLLVAGVAVLAALRARSLRQAGWHALVWMLVAGLFFALSAMRYLAAEEILRSDFRALLYAEGAYDDRRRLQGPVIAVLIGGGAVVAAVWFGRLIRVARGRRDLAAITALGCGLGMIMLVALRLVSLHSLDLLLYGPFKINWLADIGLTGLTLASALVYLRVTRRTKR